jgi:alanine dehydrogenase
VLVVGATALKQVSREEIIASMRDGSVVVNVDHRHRPGRGIETARPIPRSDPTYVDEVAIHYCVANILAEVASTSIVVLSGGLLPYLVKISDEGAGGGSDRGLEPREGHLHLGRQPRLQLVAEAHGFFSPGVPRGVRK